MNFQDFLNLNKIADNKPIFNPTFINFEYFFNLISNFFQGVYDFFFHSLSGFAATFKFWADIFFSVVAIFLITVIAYSLVRIHEIRKKEKESLKNIIQVNPVAKERNERWELVLKYSDSENQNDWRQAIIEGDSMLEELVAKMESRGDNLGEKLKYIDKADFRSLDEAWEAHKTRNKIAHEGSTFDLTKRETKRVIDLFEKVFQEFNII